jgi:hypothetical protein
MVRTVAHAFGEAGTGQNASQSSVGSFSIEFTHARSPRTWIEPASVAVLIGTFASVVTLTSVTWPIQTGRLAFP